MNPLDIAFDFSVLREAARRLPVNVFRAAVETIGLAAGSPVFGSICRRHEADEDAVAMCNGWTRDPDYSRWVRYEQVDDVRFDMPPDEPLAIARAFRRTLDRLDRAAQEALGRKASDAELAAWILEHR